MIIPDLNLLVYAYDLRSPRHLAALHWWEGCLSGSEPVGIAWLVAFGFVRLWTNSKVFELPLTADLAAGPVESWLARKVVRIVNPGDGLGQLVFRLIREAGNAGTLPMDAHLAALATEHRV